MATKAAVRAQEARAKAALAMSAAGARMELGEEREYDPKGSRR